jgi:hypothetical protein
VLQNFARCARTVLQIRSSAGYGEKCNIGYYLVKREYHKIEPIELWREIESEKETAYLLKSKKMKKRLLEAKDRKEGIPFDKACEKLGI